MYRSCLSSKKDPSRLETSIITTVTSCLPQGLARKIEEKIQQDQDNQQEWVTGILICACIATLVLFLNIVLTVAAVAIAFSKNKDQGLTSTILYRGSCSVTKNWVRALHLVINVLSTIMLAASNYCMQCLSSPSRQNIDIAHAQRIWLDIGVPSMKNLSFVGRRRCMLWIVLLISSLPIHLVFVYTCLFIVQILRLMNESRYNSAVFSALGTNEYNVLLATVDFDFKASSTIDPVVESCFEKQIPGNMSDIYSDGSGFEYLDKQECINTFASEFIAGQGTLILVTNYSTADNKPLYWIGSGNGPHVYDHHPFMWMCEQPMYGGTAQSRTRTCKRRDNVNDLSVSPLPWPRYNFNATIFSDVTYTLERDNTYPEINDNSLGHDEQHDLSNLRCFMMIHNTTESGLLQYIDDASQWKNSSWAKKISIHETENECTTDLDTSCSISDFLPIDHCRSQKVEESCQLLFNLPICITVIFCNIVKVVCMFLTARDDRREIFLTVGDAISSFLKKPDARTKGRCLSSKSSITQYTREWSMPLDDDIPPPKYLSGKKRWMKSVSISYWIVTIILYVHLLSWS